MGCGTSFLSGLLILTIQTPQKKFQLMVDPKQTLENFQQIIENHTFIPPKEQQLYHQSKHLKDPQSTLNMLSIPSQATITIKTKNNENPEENDENQLKVDPKKGQNATGKVILVKVRNRKHITYEFEVGCNIQVFYLKQLVEKKCGMPVFEQGLIFGGRFLKDFWDLEECGVKPKFTILLRMKTQNFG